MHMDLSKWLEVLQVSSFLPALSDVPVVGSACLCTWPLDAAKAFAAARASSPLRNGTGSTTSACSDVAV